MNELKNFSNIDKSDLFSVPVPSATDSYSPVSHKNIIETIEEELDKKNMIIDKESYKVGAKGNQLIGYFDIKQNQDEMGMRLAFRNSYDKSMSLAFVAGSVVWICSNGCISGDVQYMRKHTGKIASETQNKLVSSIQYIDDTFNLHLKHADQMKNIEIDKTTSAELMGRMFIEEDIITSTQLSIIKREFSEPTYNEFIDPTLWSSYNHVTHALKTSSPHDYFKKHIQLHTFIEKEFDLI